MVGSAATHRQLRKVLVRNGLLDSRSSGIGLEKVGTDTPDTDTDSDAGSGFNILSDLFPSVTIFETRSSTRSSSISSSSSSSITPVASVTHSTTTTSSSPATLSTTSASSPTLVSSSSTTPISSTTGAASESTSSSSSSAGNLIGGVAAGLIAVIALCVFGFFILRRRRQRGNELKLLHQVDPFRMSLHSKPDMSEQRMTFGALYGRPGPSYQEGQQSLVTSYSYAPPSTLYLNRTRSGSRDLTSPFADPAPYLDSPVSPNVSSQFPHSSFAECEDGASPFADLTGDGSPNPIVQSSLIIQAPPSAAVKLSPSRSPSAGFVDGLTNVSASDYSPMVRRSLGSQASPVHSKDGTRPHSPL